MGALAFRDSSPDICHARNSFTQAANVDIREINNVGLESDDACIAELGKWLKSWREHGRTRKLAIHQPGFDWARRDHNEGYFRLTGHRVTSNPPGHAPKGRDGDTFRSALGLPIIQYFSSQPEGQPNTVSWTPEWDPQEAKKNHQYKGEGRFASPVLLRPYKDAQGKWHALVIFVDAHKWPEGKPVYLNGQPRKVSLDLYERMKKDTRLRRPEFIA